MVELVDNGVLEFLVVFKMLSTEPLFEVQEEKVGARSLLYGGWSIENPIAVFGPLEKRFHRSASGPATTLFVMHIY